MLLWTLLTTQDLVIEAEAGTPNQVSITDEFVEGFEATDASISWTLTVPEAGLYALKPRYRTTGGDFKRANLRTPDGGYTLDLQGSVDWVEQEVARVWLEEGENELTWQRGWGFHDLDRLTFERVETGAMPEPKWDLIDPNASAETRALMDLLRRHYGQKMLSGQYSIDDFDYVHEVTGVYPAMLGLDLINYSPSRAERETPTPEVEKVLDYGARNVVVTLSWHWNAPTDLYDVEGQEWWRGFYTSATSFDVEAALADKDSERYGLLIRDIDVIAEQLQRIEDAGIPILWRPLHEAEGGWFWWGAKGPEPCIELWKIMVERLRDHHGLNNLIWVWNSVEPEWYPGDEWVDIVSVDAYPESRRDPLTGSWDRLVAWVGDRKPVALSEFKQAPDVDRKFRHGVRWSYFTSWNRDLGARGMDPDDVRDVYLSENTLTLDELGDWMP